MNEDERYRASTQYRLWSYTREQLASLRATTNQLAAERVKAAIQRAREARNASEGGENGSGAPNAGADGAADVNCLTVEEEQKLLTFYCRQAIQLADHLGVFPTDVKATAIQYIKRFYLTNSIMTYHPSDITKTALFLPTKSDNCWIDLDDFVSKMSNTTREDVLAYEFILLQGLRFTFDVRHPYRALDGAVMELKSLANAGQFQMLPNTAPISIPPEMQDLQKRIPYAHGKAKEYLKTSALLTDVYIHYSPSQIMLSALLLADPDMTTFYISTKIPPGQSAMREKLIGTLQGCADMLRSVPPTSQPDETEIKELKKLAKKLQKCRNPEKVDMVAVNKKRVEEGVDEKTVKKRKMEREKSQKEGESIFGGDIRKPGG